MKPLRSLYRHATNELKRTIAWIFGLKQIVYLQSFGEYRFFVSSRREAARVLAYGFEPEVLAAFLFMLNENDTVWDVGASTGLYGIHTAGIVRNTLCFEPDPESVLRLKQNLCLNGLEQRVKVMPFAVGADVGVIDLATDGLSGYAPVVCAPGLGRHFGRTKVEVHTIDGLIARGLEPPTVLKIDIEGAEGLALRGAQMLLRGDRCPRLVLVEVHMSFLEVFGGSLGDILTTFQQAGYFYVVSRKRANEVHVLAFARRIERPLINTSRSGVKDK